jgi:K+-sensing histidine kinase KdpD
VEMRGHNWDLVLWPMDNGPQGGYRGVAVFLLGLALSSVLGCLIWLVGNRGEQSDVTAALLEASHNLSSTEELSSILRVTGDTCLRISGVDRCCIFLCNESEKQWEPAWISSNREEDLRWFQSLRLKYGDMPVFNRLIEDKRSLVPQEDPSMPLLDPSLAKAFDIGSLFVVPLLSKGKITGILTLDRIGKKHRFSPREQALIEGVASQAATAVENTRLLAEGQKQDQSVAKKMRELESLLFIVSHDQKSPLLSVGGMLSLLSNEYGDHLPQEGKQCLSRIKANVTHMETLIKDLLEYLRIGRDEAPIEKIDVEEVT